MASTFKDDPTLQNRENKKRNQGFENLTEDQTFSTQLRLLLPNSDGGAVIGRGGENVKHLRYKYHAKVAVADCLFPERILKVEMMIAVVRAVVLDIMRFINSSDKERRLKVLIHDSLAGVIIGKSGSRIKQLKEKCNTYIKVYPQCAPNSTERVYEVIGKPQDIALAVLSITELLYPIQPSGVMIYYDPENYAECFIDEYGGYHVEEGFPKGYAGRNVLKGQSVINALQRTNEVNSGEGVDGAEKTAKRKRGCRAGKHKRNRLLKVCAAAVRDNKAAAVAAEQRHQVEETFGNQENKYKPPLRSFGTMAYTHSNQGGPFFRKGPGVMTPVVMNSPVFGMPPPYPSPFSSFPNHRLDRTNNFGFGEFDHDILYYNKAGSSQHLQLEATPHNSHHNYSHNNFHHRMYNKNKNTAFHNEVFFQETVQHPNNLHNNNNIHNNIQNNIHHHNINTIPNKKSTHKSVTTYNQVDNQHKNALLDNTQSNSKKVVCHQECLPISSLQPLAVELVRLRRLAEKSGSEVSIELTPLHLPEQLILNFRGTQEQIEYSRYLLHCGEMM